MPCPKSRRGLCQCGRTGSREKRNVLEIHFFEEESRKEIILLQRGNK
jgi:hypothetical protein